MCVAPHFVTCFLSNISGILLSHFYSSNELLYGEHDRAFAKIDFMKKLKRNVFLVFFFYLYSLGTYVRNLQSVTRSCIAKLELK